jgi:hypothetical protein
VSQLRIDMWADYDDDGLPKLHQATVKVLDTVEGKMVVLAIPGAFGEGKTVQAAVRAAMNNLASTWGRTR